MRSFLLILLSVWVSKVAVAQTDESMKPQVPKAPPSTTVKIKPDVGDSGGAITIAKVEFVAPKDGEVVRSPVKLRFKVEGLKVAKAGSIEPGSGHFHILIDTEAAKEGEIIPSDDRHIHYGNGQTEAEIKLSPGAHSLTLQFADGVHRAYGPLLTKTINIKVK